MKVSTPRRKGTVERTRAAVPITVKPFSVIMRLIVSTPLSAVIMYPQPTTAPLAL